MQIPGKYGEFTPYMYLIKTIGSLGSACTKAAGDELLRYSVCHECYSTKVLLEVWLRPVHRLEERCTLCSFWMSFGEDVWGSHVYKDEFARVYKLLSICGRYTF